jgi:hypothetical protein
METIKKVFSYLQTTLLIGLSVLFMTLAACKSHDSGTKKTKVDNSNPKNLELVNLVNLECIETAFFIPVDTGIAKSLIPIEHNLFIEQGKAQILFIAQNCHTATWDENDISPMEKAHIWIRLNGQDTVSPVAGVDHTAPTYYWWDYSGFTTNNAFKEYANATGWKMEPVDSIEFNLKEYGKIVGQINGQSQVIFEWFTIPTNGSEPAGINHKVFGRNSDGKFIADISGIIRPVSSGGETRLEINEDSPLSVFGKVLYGYSHDLDMTFKAVIRSTSE